MRDDTTAKLTAAVEAVLGHVPKYGIRIIKEHKRLYSSVWLVELRQAQGPRKVIIKAWPSDASFQNQIEKLTQARRVFQQNDDICIPYIGSHKSERLLIMDYVADRSLIQLLRFGPDFLQDITLRRWRDRIGRACFTAGRWLNEWHCSSAAHTSIAEPLRAYLTTRTKKLPLIDGPTQTRLSMAIQRLEPDKTNVSHGDFTPPNVLWSEQQLTVLDFGISEWDQMSPCWDYVSMEIGLLSELKFSLKSPGKWRPAFRRTVLDQFRRGYADLNCHRRTYWTCAAIRHLVLYWTDLDAGFQLRKRAAWHKQQLTIALSRAEAA